MTSLTGPSPGRTHRWPLRLVMALCALMQLGTFGLSVAAMTIEARGAGTHVEAPGLPKHFAHDERSCVACVTLGSRGLAAAVAHGPVPPVEPTTTTSPGASRPSVALRRSPGTPRAPPASS